MRSDSGVTSGRVVMRTLAAGLSHVPRKKAHLGEEPRQAHPTEDICHGLKMLGLRGCRRGAIVFKQ